jgi:hypothetical protein
MVETATKGLVAARAAAGPKARTPEFRRVEEDVLILGGLGAYYAKLFQAALVYSIFEQNNSAPVDRLQAARDSWAAMAKRAQTIYTSDISYGSTPFRRGHWADRLPAIDADLALLEMHYGVRPGVPIVTDMQLVAIRPRPAIAAKHAAPKTFHPGDDLPLTIGTPAVVTKAILWYRHVNHGERWLSTPMQKTGSSHTAAIPAAYTASPYPLQYYFELHTADAATLYPPLNPTLSNQPYYAIHRRA